MIIFPTTFLSVLPLSPKPRLSACHNSYSNEREQSNLRKQYKMKWESKFTYLIDVTLLT